MDDSQFRRILDFFHLSWKGYRKVRKGVKKRLARFMEEKKMRGAEPLLALLERDPEQRAAVRALLAVSISRFFRDRELWRALEERLFPQIAAQEERKVKVWSAGCARGEEVYSLKILWEEWRQGKGRVSDLEIWATDLNPESLEGARAGVYPPGSLKEVPEERRSRHFRPLEGNRRAVSESLKEGIRWKVHDLLADAPPDQGFQIILLRNNLLTYCQDDFLRPALGRIVDSLSPGGFLITGAREKLPPGPAIRLENFHLPCVHRKICPGPCEDKRTSPADP